MNRLTFRAVFGGPAIPPDFSRELRRIRTHLQDIPFDYDLDMFLVVGGNLRVITDPSGLKIPRVSLAKKRVTASIMLNSQEVLSAQDPRGLMRSVIYEAVCQVMGRIAARDKAFDKSAELKKLDFLTCPDWSSPENIKASEPDEEPLNLIKEDDPEYTEAERNIINTAMRMGVKFPD